MREKNAFCLWYKLRLSGVLPYFDSLLAPALALGLKCKTAIVIMKAVYGVTVGCWILSLLFAIAQLRFLSRHYMSDLKEIFRGSVMPFPRGQRPSPYYALYKSTTFIGAFDTSCVTLREVLAIWGLPMLHI